jgi:hypothetical protein
MFEEYEHLLVPHLPNFVPEKALFASFFKRLEEFGCLPESPKIAISQVFPSERATIIGTNPFTGELMVATSAPRVLGKPRFPKNTSQITRNIGALPEYRIEVSGYGRPRFPLLPIACDKPYYIAIACNVRSTAVSTSFVGSGDQPMPRSVPPRFDENCGRGYSAGYFLNPTTSRVVKVQKAGRARFWISIGLGKFLQPQLGADNFCVLAPQLVDFVDSHFQVKFAQGCKPAC